MTTSINVLNRDKKYIPLEEVERKYISLILSVVDTRKHAAKILGINEATLFRKVKRYNIQPYDKLSEQENLLEKTE